jgi:Na+:H+ antiporter, NhaA family
MSYILVSLKIAKLPTNIKWKQILGMGTLAGIGFTMSIFTTMLAYTDDATRDIAKVAILLSVTLSAIFSIIYFWAIGVKAAPKPKLIHPHQPELHLKLA